MSFGGWEWARVSGIVTSQVIDLPRCHGISVQPSTSLSLPSRVKPLGSFCEGTCAFSRARQTISLMASCLGIRTGPWWHYNLWLPIRSTLKPLGYSCSLQRSIPRRKPIATRLVIQSPPTCWDRPGVQPMTVIWVPAGSQQKRFVVDLSVETQEPWGPGLLRSACALWLWNSISARPNIKGTFLSRMLAQSYTPNIYTPTPNPLLYNHFTIVLHESLCPHLSRPSCAHILPVEMEQSETKTFTLLRRSQSGTRFIGRIPRVCEFRIKQKETDCSVA